MSTGLRGKLRFLVVGITAAGSVFVGTSSWAQPAASAAAGSASASSEEQLGEVIVTATRVETQVEKTPVAINVYTGGELLKQSVTDLASLQNIDPTINITESDTPYIAIRGVASANTTEVGQPSVSTAHDGFFTNRMYDLDLAMYDLQRVEIDKGPQGTLFGRNSTGGVINIVSAPPVLGKLDGYVNVNVGNYSMYDGEGAVSLPIGDTLAFRISLFDHMRSGYIHIHSPPYTDYWADDDRSQSGRLQLLRKPSSRFDLTVRYQRDHMNEYGHVGVNVPAGQPFDPATAASSVPGYVNGANKLQAWRSTWIANLYQLPLDSVLTYQGGVDYIYFHDVYDASSPPTPPSTAATLAIFEPNEHVTTWNHELRLATSQQRRVFAQVGLFYFSERNN